MCVHKCECECLHASGVKTSMFQVYGCVSENVCDHKMYVCVYTTVLACVSECVNRYDFCENVFLCV